MSELVDRPPTEREPALYSVFSKIAQGMTRTQAVEEVDKFSFRSLSAWTLRWPDWIAGIRERAVADVSQQRRTDDLAIAALALDTERTVRRMVFEAAEDVVRQTLKVAKGGGEGDTAIAHKDQIAAARLVRAIVHDGFAYDQEGPPRPPDDEMESLLPYDPHTFVITRESITLPPGSKVTVETPDEIEPMPDPLPD